MTSSNQKSSNPIIPEVARVETLSRGFLVNRRQTLKPIERLLGRDPETATALDQTGGFPNLLIKGEDQTIERDYLSRFSNMQTSLFVDRLTQGDISTTPALETMYESSRGNNKILTSIAQELESCCEEIKNRLENLDKLFRSSIRQWRDLIRSNSSNLEVELKTRFERLKIWIRDSTLFLEAEIKRNITNLFVKSKTEIEKNCMNVINNLKTEWTINKQ